MIFISLAFGSLCAVASLIWTRSLWGPTKASNRVAGAALILGSLAGLVGHASRVTTSELKGAPKLKPSHGYVSSNNCRSCHPDQYRSWHASYHRTMTQRPNGESVLAPFDGQEIEIEGRTYRPFRKGGQFWMEMEEYTPNRTTPRRVQRQVVMTTGSHHMQLYWFGIGKGRLAHSPIVYLLDEERWIPRYASFIIPTECGEARIKEGPNAGQWNLSCIECHSTHGRPKMVSAMEMNTEVAELGISCESCHGPASEHVAIYQNPLNRYAVRSSESDQHAIVNAKRLTNQRASETCGQCHSVQHANSTERYLSWITDGHEYRPGDTLEDSRLMVTPANRDHPTMKVIEQRNPDFVKSTFWSDGMVRVAGREFTAMRETECFLNGDLTCLSCHELHRDDMPQGGLRSWADDQLSPGMRTNHACLQCHESMANEIEAHTHHAPASSGSQCYNCHMPYTTYGLLKAIRSHQIDSPDVRVTVKTGRPNACNLCHLDKTLEWTAHQLKDWYDIPSPELREEEKTVSASLLWLLKGEAGQRALVAWAMSWPPALEASGRDWIAPFLAQLLVDPYDAVRFVAWRSIREAPEFEGLSYDFVGPFADRETARDQIVEQWRTKTKVKNYGAVLLLDSDGRLNWDALKRLLDERDDSKITLVE